MSFAGYLIIRYLQIIRDERPFGVSVFLSQPHLERKQDSAIAAACRLESRRANVTKQNVETQ